MAKVHEILGIQVEQNGLMQAMYDTELEAHLKTIQLLRDLKSGAIEIERVEVEGNTWTVRPKVDAKPDTVMADESVVNEPVASGASDNG